METIATDPMDILDECVINLLNHSNVTLSLEAATHALNTYPEEEQDDDGELSLRWFIIDHLVSNCKILTHLFNHMDHLQNTDKDHAKDTTHCIKFLLYLTKNHPFSVTQTQIKSLYHQSMFAITNTNNSEAFTLLCELLLNLLSKSTFSQDEIHQISNQLFTDYLTPYLNDMRHIHTLHQHGFNLFSHCFIVVNQHIKALQCLTSPPRISSIVILDYEHLIGVDILWNIIIHCHDEAITKEASNIYNTLSTFLSDDTKHQTTDIRTKTLSQIMNSLQNMHEIEPKVSLLRFLHNLLDASELRGLRGLKKHSALISGDAMDIKIINAIDYTGYGAPPQLMMRMNEYDTLWKLKEKMTTKATRAVTPDMVRVHRKGLQLAVNSKTLVDYGIDEHSILRCSQRDHRSLRLPLLTTDNPAQLQPKCVAALTEIWNEFATHEVNGKLMMDYQDMKQYILSCGAGENSAQRSRVNAIFTQHNQGSNDTNFWGLEGFLSFYRQACLDRVDHVWNDLEVQGFRYDLKKVISVDIDNKENEFDREALCGYTISAKDEWFSGLCGECAHENATIRELASELIFRIPTNPSIEQAVCDVKSDWNKWMKLDDVDMMMYYALIWESMVFGDTRNDEWIASFIRDKKGFDYLFKILFLLAYAQSKLELLPIRHLQWTKRILKMIHSFCAKHIAFNPLMTMISFPFTSITGFNEDELMAYGIGEDRNHFMHFVCLLSKYKALQ
eukprot:1008984_1